MHVEIFRTMIVSYMQNYNQKTAQFYPGTWFREIKGTCTKIYSTTPNALSFVGH
jgi:hypothetical protein